MTAAEGDVYEKKELKLKDKRGAFHSEKLKDVRLMVLLNMVTLCCIHLIRLLLWSTEAASFISFRLGVAEKTICMRFGG